MNVGIRIHVGTCLKSWKFFCFIHSISFPYYYLWSRTKTYLHLTLEFIQSILDTVLTCILHCYIYLHHRMVYTFRVLRYLIAYLSISRNSHDVIKFRHSLKNFLSVGSFYSLEEFFAWETTLDLGNI